MSGRSGDAGDLRALPRQMARTQRFSLGVPRATTVADDGSHLLFLRSRSGQDRTSCLWVLDGDGERLLADPDDLGDLGDDSGLSDAELARRERVRERTSGIVAFSADRAAAIAAFALGAGLWLATLDGRVTSMPCAGPPVDPRIDPSGRHVAYVAGGALHVLTLSDRSDALLAAPESADVTYGLPEHVAAEEMHRLRGHWWSPDGTQLLVARVDNGRVRRWWVSDPSDPNATPRQVFYPVAGSPNARVTLSIVGLDGTATGVLWDQEGFEYLATAAWDEHGPLISVQTRDQRTVRTLAVDPATGQTSLLGEDTDPCWVRLVPGAPARTGLGRLVTVSDADGARRLLVDGAAVTADNLQVREVLGVHGETVWFAASTDPTEEHVWTYSPVAAATPFTCEPGLHRAFVGGETVVLHSFTETGHVVRVHGPALGGTSVASLDEEPLVTPGIRWLTIGERAIRTALVLPTGHRDGDRRLPVLLCPYAGPAMQRVTRARHWHFVEAQWFADQGFAVVIADGAGTPGRGPDWEREIAGDVLSPVLADQVAALEGTAQHCGDLDLGRVAIRGWSYGGLLSLAAVLRLPDVFHAAVAGAAPTDMRLYDTHYRERYLGHPDEQPDSYARCSPLFEAGKLRRPLLLVHGLADDNVVVANTLRMSSALVAAGKPHELLLLPSTTHVARDPNQTADLLMYELGFLSRSLADHRD